MESISLETIHNDLELLKKAVAEIRIAVNIEPKLREEIKQQVNEARERIKKGEFVSNEEILKEFNTA
ncbi:MAG TPA: hypothetical protein ENG87_01420 [Candidatus Pacearchaeota archaeon]|nr:hypothetical protein BMS3Abin17_01003 [archaeon BMS3Abin17]HDK42010.1 hypothetical protein [Candidatus Pacearchaeota archaeon]HDZ60768.1 hypothetical protein [Candidatus Pacearchaeota archaeon]